MERDPNPSPAEDITPEDAKPDGSADEDATPAPLHAPGEDPAPVEERAGQREG